MKLLVLISLCLVVVVTNCDTKRYKLVAYWGQNGVYGIHKDRGRWEKPLDHFCKNSAYDVIVLAFNNIFFDSRNKDSMPSLNFAFHCSTPVGRQYPTLLRCPRIQAAVGECHRRGKKVLLSMGGATGRYGFNNNAQARQYANIIWNLFLGGNSMRRIRPFGNAVLDGVDLDIEGGSSTGYTAFVREIRRLMDSHARGRYIIAAAPQCPFPDRYLGPSRGKALGDVGHLFDEVYVQFYNNWCHTGNPRVFWGNVAKLLKFSMDSRPKGPQIFVGIPAKTGGSGNPANYRPLNELRSIFQRLKNEPRFGGFMLWDASFDQNNIINGKTYSQNIAEMMKIGGGTGPRPPVPTVNPNACRRTVLGLYFGVLHRNPDNGGFNHWVRQCRKGDSFDSLFSSFMTSAEYREPCNRKVRDLYINVLQRQPDRSGLNHHLGECKRGRTFKVMLKVFIDSGEFKSKYNDACKRTVTGLYFGVLHRTPDNGGFNHWVGQCRRGQSFDSLFNSFMSSAEYREPCNRKVRDLYINVLRRQPDRSGLNHHLGECKRGRTLKQMLKIFIDSGEFKSKYNGMIKFE